MTFSDWFLFNLSKIQAFISPSTSSRTLFSWKGKCSFYYSIWDTLLWYYRGWNLKYLKNKMMACPWVGFDLLIFRGSLPEKCICTVYCQLRPTWRGGVSPRADTGCHCPRGGSAEADSHWPGWCAEPPGTWGHHKADIRTLTLFIIYRRKAIPSPSLTPPVQRSLSELSLAWTSVSEVTWGERDIIRWPGADSPAPLGSAPSASLAAAGWSGGQAAAWHVMWEWGQ